MGCHSSDRLPASTRVASDSLAANIELAMPTLRHDTATVIELSAEGTTLDATYRDSTLQRLRAVYLGEMGRATETFYFDTSLFLVVRGEVRYDTPLSGNVADSSTQRFDLRADSTARSVRDSLLAEARTLLGHLRSARKP
jgi:hypothetical protein